MDITITNEQDRTVVTIIGRMDSVSAPEFDKKVQAEIDGGAERFVVDLAQLDYISSAGLRSMLAMAKKLKMKNGTSILSGLKGVVNEVFEISGFSNIFTICETKEEALQK
jgi:anti-anti-sigma factor